MGGEVGGGTGVFKSAKWEANCDELLVDWWATKAEQPDDEVGI